MCPLTANVFWTGSCSYKVCAADGRYRKADRHRNITQMHANQNISDIHSRMRPDMFLSLIHI